MTKENTKISEEEQWINTTWNTYSSQIYHLCKSRCYNTDDADDLFQNVALKFCENAKKLHKRDSVLPWLLKVFKNCHYDANKKSQKTVPFSVVSDTVSDYHALPTEKSALYKPENYRNDTIHRIIKSLNKRDQEILDLYFNNEFKTEELCLMFNVSHTTISRRRQIALSRVKNKLTR